MNRFIQERGKIRKRISQHKIAGRFLPIYITLILSINLILILYTMLSVTVRMTVGGVGLIDSLPIALYILPLTIFLPVMIRAFYQSRTAAWNFVFLIIASVFFSMLSLLVRGFIVCVLFNIIAVVSIFFLGRFRPKGNIRSAGKKGIAYIILMNMLGLTFPVSIIVMGQVPIAHNVGNLDANISFSVPLADFDFPYSNLTPTSSIVTELENNQFQLDLRVLEDNNESWLRLQEWLAVLNGSAITYTITLTANRAQFVGPNPTALATTPVIEEVYDSHLTALDQLSTYLANITSQPQYVLFDMTFSQAEWQKLMFHTRSLDLIGFTGLMRSSIYATDPLIINQKALLLSQAANDSGFSTGLLVESFVVDDMQDNDNVAMRLSGATLRSLEYWNMIAVSCDRSRFSVEMNGDVGEYLVESYSKSVGRLSSKYSLRMGMVGNIADVQGRNVNTYDSLQKICSDITLATGNGVSNLTVDSLPSLISSFGPTALTELRTLLNAGDIAYVTYTFRIYAYRAVFIAIDSFDLLML